MHTELIKALKEDAEWAHANEWETPITLGDHLDAAAAALDTANANAKLFDEATARAEAAEAERDACKADFEACMRGGMESCAYCIHDDECEPGESLCYANVCGFEWRGQQAGKGDAPNE